MSIEQIGILCGALAAVISLVTPLVRLNGLLSRLNVLLDALRGRTVRCEERLDEHDLRFAHGEAELAALREAVTQMQRRIDEFL